MSCRLLAALTFAAVLPPLCQAQRVAEAPEPNDAPAQATALPCGAEAEGVLSSFADVDCYRVVLAAATELWASTGPGPAPEIGDTVLTLLDGTGGPLRAAESGVASGDHAVLFVPSLPAGTYYLQVARGAAGALNGSYVLDVRCRAIVAAGSPPPVIEGAENNDPRSGGVPTFAALPARCYGALSQSGQLGDWDFFQVVLFADSVLRARVDATAAIPSGAADDLALYLFDGQTPPGLLLGPVLASDPAAHDQVMAARVAAGTYRVAVRGVDGSAAGAYRLDLSATPAARVTTHPGGCGGRTLDVGATASGPGAPLRLERPATGSTWSLRGSNLGSFGYSFHAIGFAATSLDLTAFGAPGCTLEVLYADIVFQLADGGGQAVWWLTIPDNTSLLGGQLESQVAVLDLSNALGITLSNRVSAVLGD
ncbi:MAG: PPC domain-containing protein [Planctomycetes bacterium]|nr:PPC domain-containing protein [Planctomycetota bacterium]